MSNIPKRSALYKCPSEKVRKNRRVFYDLQRGKREDTKTWFERIKNIGRSCKFARNRQFIVICDKFVCELGTDEIERIKHKINGSWSLQQLNKYFEDENVWKKRIESLKVNHENTNENKKLRVKILKSETDDDCSRDEPGEDFGDDDNLIVELIPYVSDGEEVEEEQRENEAKAKEGEEIGMEHEISTPIQHKSDEIEITNSENVPIASASLDNDMNSETLLDTIKCELDGYEYVTTDQLQFEVCDIDNVKVENGHENQNKSAADLPSHFPPQQPSTSHDYSDCYKKLDDGTFTYQCDECEKTFTRSIGLKHHKQNEHNKTTPFVCGHCDKHFTTSSILSEHLLTHGGSARFACDKCNQSFSYLSNLNLHINNAHQKVDEPKSRRTPYECDHCDKWFKTIQRLKDHKNMHIVHQCDQCNKSFSSRSKLSAHVTLVHKGNLSHVCHICDLHFACRKNLNYHLATHMIEKPYTCNFCDESFSQIMQLAMHKKHIHRATKKFKCKICNRSFFTAKNLQSHLQSNHRSDNRYPCDLCSDSFKNALLLRKHRLEHHPSAF